ncbi:uncharacterized protein LOC132188527 [Corylus avellana]|uniref:uncharacterized protein LOC132188527 n=1 Tax=Corylus avellana TaxID=13451 RepID=UPI001E225EA4|nr:uncharacterized protein LOC132188527 [Corylus avellana]
MAGTKVTLKLLIDTKRHRVLFAEADKQFVDFLFSIFTLPVGTVTRLLQKKNMAGCLHSLYESIENLSDIYIQPDQDKDFLLNPKIAISGAQVPLLLPRVENSDTDRKFYRCSGYNNCNYVANDPRANCPSCRNPMTTEQSYVEHSCTDMKFYRCGSCSNSCKSVANDPRAHCPRCRNPMTREVNYVEYPPRDINKNKAASSSSEGGYVKGLITYMVMDNLDVKPMSTISAISLLSKFNVTDVGAVEEKVVNFGMDEGVKLLVASLQSKTVLTDVFLPKDRIYTVNE